MLQIGMACPGLRDVISGDRCGSYEVQTILLMSKSTISSEGICVPQWSWLHPCDRVICLRAEFHDLPFGVAGLEKEMLGRKVRCWRKVEARCIF